MDVRCERCRAQYVFDDDQVTPAGLTVRCTNCGHIFRVKKKELVVTVPVRPDEIHSTPMPATAAAPRPGVRSEPQLASARASAAPGPQATEPREWRVRQANGNLFTFRELTTLQKWIVERKVSRDDEISLSGDQWKRLGNIAELASFFQVVEAASRGNASPPPPLAAASQPTLTFGAAAVPGLRPPPPPPPSGFPPPSFAARPAVPPPAPRPAPAVVPVVARPASPAVPDPDPDLDLDDRAAVSGSGRRRTVLLSLALILAAAAAAFLALRPVAKKPPPEELAVPLTIQVAPPPAAPEPPAEPPPVAAPEPVPEPLPPPPPEKVAPKPAAPKGPKALLAEAARLRSKGQVEKALDLYGRVVDDDTGNVDALVGRGLCYLDLSEYPPAEASFQAALQAAPGDPDALLGLAETYRWQGKNTEAIRYYEQYLAQHPDGEEAAAARNALEELRR
jgi:predicted Zn finger-like uncharacterized protein